MDYKIMFAGVSGVGKTTLAKWLSETFDIEFISGSYSDLIPETKDMPHQEMINQDAETVFRQDMQLLSARSKACRDAGEFVTDRSYLDSAAYFINKLSHRIAPCDLEHAIDSCKQLLSRQCTHLIFIPYSVKFFKDWVIEDNNKRLLSKYYQFQVSQVIYGLLELWGYKKINNIVGNILYGLDNFGYIEILGTRIDVLVLDEMNIEKRKYIVRKFLGI